VIFVDTNILIDLNRPHDPWRAWSEAQLDRLSGTTLLINHVVLAELAGGYDDLKSELSFLDLLDIVVVPITDEAAFLAGQAYAAYRLAGGPRQAILPDFLIGGHALSLGATLLTRDRQRFASYFPDLTLITPETEQ
jgi:predicted nucleic acid-binding protein